MSRRPGVVRPLAPWIAVCLLLAASSATASSETRDRGLAGCAVIENGGQGADRLMTPASTLKLVVVAAAFHALGPDYRAQTRVVAEGPVDGLLRGDLLRGDLLRGDLVWIGGGDPTWNERFFEGDPRAPIRRLVEALRERGLRRVTGDLVIDTSAFPGRPFPAVRAINEIAFGFAAPTSAVAVDEGAFDFYIAPGQEIGAPAVARPVDPRAVPTDFRVRNFMTTASRERDGRGTVDFQPVWQSLDLVLRGEYPISEPPYRLSLSVPDGDRWAGEAIARELEAAGIVVEGELRVRSEVAPARPHTALAVLRSPPLARWAEPILHHSLNWYAEMLLRQLAFAETGEGRDDTGLDLLGAFLTDTVGVEPGSFHLDDASGVSPYNLITPRALVQVLDWARRQPWSDAWLAALPESKTGTLEAWPALPAGMVAKTGTLRHTLALAGYARVQSPKPVAFACLLNHRPDSRPALRRELVGKVRSILPPS